MKKVMEPKIELDEYEQDLEDSFARGEWVSVDNLEEMKNEAQEAARNYFRFKKSHRINLRINEIDLLILKKDAAYEGIPYQTYITSILHKYAEGNLR